MDAATIASPEYDVIIGTAPAMCVDSYAPTVSLIPLDTKIAAVELPELLSQRIFAGREGSVFALTYRNYHSSDELASLIDGFGLAAELIFSTQSATTRTEVFGVREDSQFLSQLLTWAGQEPGLGVELLYR